MRRLDDHALDVLGREVLVDQLVGLARVADVGLLVLGRLDAERAADDQRDDHEGEPAEDRLLAVLGAPAAHTGSKVVLHCG